MTDYDYIIVGGGHNGLVCASYLGQEGKKVLVLERRSVLGGPVVTEELWPGFHCSVASFWMSLLQPKVMIDLDLRRHGIEVLSTPPGFQPFLDGTSFIFWDDVERMQAEIRKFSEHDAEAYPRFVKHMSSMMPILRRLLFEEPINPATGRLKDRLKTISFAWRFRDAAPRMYDIWDLLTLSAHDFLKRWFVSEQMLTAFGCYASGSGGNISPKTPGSAYVLARPMLRDPDTPAGPGGLVKGGMGSITKALEKSARSVGVDIRTNAEVAEIVVRDGVATGVRLASGEQLNVKKGVISNANAKTLYLKLLKPEVLSKDVVEAARRIRTESSCFKINVACSALPKWTAYESRGTGNMHPGSVTIAENLHELENAFESAKAGRMAERPYLWILAPSAFDDTVSPPGQHVLSIFGGHVPYALKDRAWDDAAKGDLLKIVLDQIDRYAPGFSSGILHSQVLTPPDLEAMFDLPGGHVHHGELSMDQIFFRRPIAGYADYTTPIKSLYLCGASTHPGGGVTGVPGHNAAHAILGKTGGYRSDANMRLR